MFKVIDDRVILDKTVADQVSIWKSSRGLTDKVVMDHSCSGETCSYYQIGDVFVCEKTGHVHGTSLNKGTHTRVYMSFMQMIFC